MSFAPAKQRGGLPADGCGAGCHPFRVRRPFQVALQKRRFGAPGGLHSAREHLATHLLMGPAEGLARTDQGLSSVCREQAWVGRSVRQPVPVELEMPDEQCSRPQRVESVVNRGENSRLVFLEVPVVGKWQALENCRQSDEAAQGPTGTTPQQLGDVWVLLLRHEA